MNKKDSDKPYWKRLVKEEGKNNFVTVDWAKYVDEDEEQEDGMKGIGNDWDPSAMQG